MTLFQEECLYDFIDKASSSFSTEQVVEHVLKQDATGSRHLPVEIKTLFLTHRPVFPLSDKQWISRKAVFENKALLIKPSRIEIANGVLIPGHRAIPLMNPRLMPHELQFYYDKKPIPSTTIEAPPEEIYSFYDLFGPEYSPQYVASDNEQNEKAYNADPFEDPAEVSITCLDMRSFYRKHGFSPEDYVRIHCSDWEEAVFELSFVSKKMAQASISGRSLANWEKQLREGFNKSFLHISAGISIEEQIAWAYWFAGEEVFELPAMALEEFLLEQDNGIVLTNYGMESRLWQLGKEIDFSQLEKPFEGQADLLPFETALAQAGARISLAIVGAFICDALWQDRVSVQFVYDRLVPSHVQLDAVSQNTLLEFIQEGIEILKPSYNRFKDYQIGEVRNAACNLFQGILQVESSMNLLDNNFRWLSKHLFAAISQLKYHCAEMLETMEIELNKNPQALESFAISLTIMEETWSELYEDFQESQHNWRKDNLSLVKTSQSEQIDKSPMLIAQLNLLGTNFWRRLLLPQNLSLYELHEVIQRTLGWSGRFLHGFLIDGKTYGNEEEDLETKTTCLSELVAAGISEITYFYDFTAEWEFTIKLIGEEHLYSQEVVYCSAGEGACPPEHIGGPLSWRRMTSAIYNKKSELHREAIELLGENFNSEEADISQANRALATFRSKHGTEKRDK